MKRISYRYKHIYPAVVQNGIELTPAIEKIYGESITCADSEWTPEKIAGVKDEAYNSEYTVEDFPDEPEPLTRLDAVEAQATYTAMMTDTMMEVSTND